VFASGSPIPPVRWVNTMKSETQYTQEENPGTLVRGDRWRIERDSMGLFEATVTPTLCRLPENSHNLSDKSLEVTLILSQLPKKNSATLCPAG
jgi:hypothetical protein